MEGALKELSYSKEIDFSFTAFAIRTCSLNIKLTMRFHRYGPT